MTAINKIVTFINRLPLPNRAWIIFGLCLIWWITDFLIQYERISTYYNNLLMSGTLPPEADSIGIPIMSYVFGDISLGLMFGCYLTWALWGIKPHNIAINFNKQKPIRSTISWLVTGIWLFAASVMFVGTLLERNFVLTALQVISFYCAIATNAAVQNK
jgi:hypothetical protein